MRIKVENLKKGDEIMIAANSQLIIAKLLREPVIRMIKDPTGIRVPKLSTWGVHLGLPLYTSMKCQVKTKTISTPNNYYPNNVHIHKEYDHSLEDYNDEKYFDLNFRDIWLMEK